MTAARRRPRGGGPAGVSGRYGVKPLLGLLSVGALLTGCTTGSTPGQETSGPATTRPGGSVSQPVTTPPHTVASTPETPPSTSPLSTSESHTSATAPAPPGNTCTALTIRVLQGGATPGREIAAVTFDNDSGKACTISGYPTVVLKRGGTVLVNATPTPGTVATPVRLAPGRQAQALITDQVANCNAPLSDTIEVTAPNGAAGGTLTRPFRLRNCTVHVDPVKPSD